MKEKILIVGAGITGLTLARLIAEKDKNVTVVEKRSHIGGNCYDYFDNNGNYVKPYGPHIFHTKHEEVYNFLSKFTAWKTYKHKVYVEINDKLFVIPFNIVGIKNQFNSTDAKRIIVRLEHFYKKNENISILDLKKKKEDYYLNMLSTFIYENIFKNYTIKQWDIKPEDISKEVINRVPFYNGRNNYYFKDDTHQGMPKYGYTNMFNNIINHENISITLNKDYRDIDVSVYDKVFITSPIDEYFYYKYGKLQYRRIFVKLQTYMNRDSFQSNSVINYPNKHNFTRISEFNKFLKINNDSTVVGFEYPSWDKGYMAYPVLTEENLEKVNKYFKDSKKEKNVFFVGRLAEYKYYNMDQACKRAIDLVGELYG